MTMCLLKVIKSISFFLFTYFHYLEIFKFKLVLVSWLHCTWTSQLANTGHIALLAAQLCNFITQLLFIDTTFELQLAWTHNAQPLQCGFLFATTPISDGSLMPAVRHRVRYDCDRCRVMKGRYEEKSWYISVYFSKQIFTVCWLILWLVCCALHYMLLWSFPFVSESRFVFYNGLLLWMSKCITNDKCCQT